MSFLISVNIVLYLVVFVNGLTVEELQAEITAYTTQLTATVQSFQLQLNYLQSNTDVRNYVADSETEVLRTLFNEKKELFEGIGTNTSERTHQNVLEAAGTIAPRYSTLKWTLDDVYTKLSYDSTPIGFCATGAEKYGFDYVRYTSVLYSYNSSYSSESGTFTCPQDGLYWFSLSLHRGDTGGSAFSAGIAIGDTVRYVTMNQADKESCSISIIATCSQNTRVRVKEIPTTLDIEFPDDTTAYTNFFSGYLLHKFA